MILFLSVLGMRTFSSGFPGQRGNTPKRISLVASTRRWVGEVMMSVLQRKVLPLALRGSLRPLLSVSHTCLSGTQMFQEALGWFSDVVIHEPQRRGEVPPLVIWKNAVAPGTWIQQQLASNIFTTDWANRWVQRCLMKHIWQISPTYLPTYLPT